MHDDEVEIRVDVARALIDQQFPQFRAEDVVPVAGAGTVNAIFRIGTGHSARFPLRRMDPAACGQLLAAEAGASATFASHCPVPSPRPVGLGRPGAGYPMPWSIQTWLPGELATPTGQAGSAAFAGDLAALVAALRRVDPQGRGFDGRGRGGTLSDHDGWMEQCLARSEGLLDVARLRTLWQRLRRLPPPDRLAMCHRDLIPANLLVAGERLVGVLDTGSFGPTDPALDLVAGWHLLDSPARARFRDALAIPDAEWLRGAAWAFEQAMGLVWYYRLSNPTMSALGRSTLHRLLEAAELDALAT